MDEEQREPLWPRPIPVIGVTGEYASGKTLFGLSVCPGPGTLVYDTEKSSESYEALGFDRVDVPAEMLRLHPRGYKPIDTFKWWRDHVRKISPGKYRVIVLDTVSEIESGLADYVLANPQEFGKTPGQYAKASALMWGDVKEYWKAVLSDLTSRCETFVFVAHTRTVWAGNTPTAKRAPKGKETLEELASLYLWMERKADAKGNVPPVPSAVVRKSRLAHTGVVNGKLQIIPILPPRLPEATPDAIRRYQLEPPDYAKLSKDERAPEQVMTDDERAAVRLATAEAERDAEQLRLERIHRQQNPPGRPAATTPPPTQPKEANGTALPAKADPKPVFPRQVTLPADDPVTEQQLQQLGELREELFARDQNDKTREEQLAIWKQILKKRGVETAKALTAKQAAELIGKLRHQLEIRDLHDGIYPGAAAEAAPPF